MENVHYEKTNQLLTNTYTVIRTILFFGLMALGVAFIVQAIVLLNTAQ